MELPSDLSQLTADEAVKLWPTIAALIYQMKSDIDGLRNVAVALREDNDRLKDENDRLKEDVDKFQNSAVVLYKDVMRLNKENTELRKELGMKKSGVKVNIPPWVKKNRQKRKDGGERKKRSGGYSRKSDEPTVTEVHAMDECPDCGACMSGGKVKWSRVVIEIPAVEAQVVEHLVMERECGKCHRVWTPDFDIGEKVIGKRRFGVSVHTMVCVMREVFRMPIRMIKELMWWRYGLKISIGQLDAMIRDMAERGSGAYREIRDRIRGSPVVYADETGWREDGVNGYVWAFSNDESRYYKLHGSRGRGVVEEALGDGFDGVLVSDFYAAYKIYKGPHQWCWVHLLRDIHTLMEKNPDHEQLRAWAGWMNTVYQDAKGYKGHGSALPLDVQQQLRELKRSEYEEWLTRICSPWVDQDVPMQTLCKRAMNYMDGMFTFVAYPYVDSDNNAAERSIRPLVVARKISGGTRSERGSETKSVLSSLFGTWKLHNTNPFQAARDIILNPS